MLNVWEITLERPVTTGRLLRVDDGNTISLKTRCYAFVFVKCIAPINAGVYMEVVGSGTSSSAASRECISTRNIRNDNTSGSSNRGLVVMMGTKYNVVSVVVRMEVRGPIRLLAWHTFMVWKENVKVVGRNITIATTAMLVLSHMPTDNVTVNYVNVTM